MVAVGDGERILENLRQRLCMIKDFAPHTAFQRVDRNGSSRVNHFELLAFLRDHHNYTASEAECRELLQFFDSDNDGYLGFQE